MKTRIICKFIIVSLYVQILFLISIQNSKAEFEFEINSDSTVKKPGKLEIISPVEKQTVKPGELLNILWNLDEVSKINENMLAIVILSSNYGLRLDTLKTLAIKERKFIWKVPDTISNNLTSKIIIVPAMENHVNRVESKIFFINTENKYLKNRLSVSTGINFNYAADPKFNGLYFGASIRLPDLNSIWFINRVGLDLYMAQGKIVHDEEIDTISSSSLRVKKNHKLEITNVYPSASILLGINNNWSFILPHLEFIRSKRILSATETLKRTQTIQVDSTRDTTITTEFIESFQKTQTFNSTFLGGGLDFIFYDDIFEVNPLLKKLS